MNPRPSDPRDVATRRARCSATPSSTRRRPSSPSAASTARASRTSPSAPASRWAPSTTTSPRRTTCSSALLEERTEGCLAQLAPHAGRPEAAFARGSRRASAGCSLTWSSHRAFFAIANEHGLFAGAAAPGRAAVGAEAPAMETLSAVFRAIVEEGIASGDLEPLDADALARFLGGTMRAFVLSSLRRGRTRTCEEQRAMTSTSSSTAPRGEPRARAPAAKSSAPMAGSQRPRSAIPRPDATPTTTSSRAATRPSGGPIAPTGTTPSSTISRSSWSSATARGGDVLECGGGNRPAARALRAVRAVARRGSTCRRACSSGRAPAGSTCARRASRRSRSTTQSFDVTCAFKVLAHVPEIGRALAEMARVTRPGGVVVAEFYNPVSLRGLVKRFGRPARFEPTRESAVYTRFDAPWVIPRLLPPSLTLEAVRGVRIVTPAAAAMRVPGVRAVAPLGRATAGRHARGVLRAASTSPCSARAPPAERAAAPHPLPREYPRQLARRAPRVRARALRTVRRWRSSVSRTTSSNASGEQGFARKASQPAAWAPSEWPASPSGACPVSASTGMCFVRSSRLSRRVASQPSMTGSDRSMMMRSGTMRLAVAIASAPSPASATGTRHSRGARRTSAGCPRSRRPPGCSAPCGRALRTRALHGISCGGCDHAVTIAVSYPFAIHGSASTGVCRQNPQPASANCVCLRRRKIPVWHQECTASVP